MMESLKKEVSAPDSKMSAAELDQAKAILSEVEKDPEADTKVIADKIRAQMRQRRVCKVCEKTEEPLSLCARYYFD
jgi:ubiquitin C-terminal hydrolase